VDLLKSQYLILARLGTHINAQGNIDALMRYFITGTCRLLLCNFLSCIYNHNSKGGFETRPYANQHRYSVRGLLRTP